MKPSHRKVAGASAPGSRQPAHAPDPQAARAPAWRAVLGAVTMIAGAAAMTPAHAALGQGVASVETDRLQVRASVRQMGHAAYTVHELTTDMNGVVREYVSTNGQVFAVTWHGPTMPNLQQVLGVHFETAAAIKRAPYARNHVAGQSGKLVFESSGHLRSFHGRAYLADALPAGVSANDIQ